MSVAMLITALGGAALAVHDDGIFQLDRNAIDDAAGDDWANIYSGPNGADASTGILHDPINATIFTGGGSKDDLNTTGWKHKTGSSPDKDELGDAFAARYGDVVYFGADRLDASGAAALGFWFFQQEVGAQAGGTFGPGQHADGDVLILSDFSVGGGTVTIRVFQWNGPGGSIAGQGEINGVLDLLAGSNDPDVGTPADCVGPPEVGEPDPFCATVNAADAASPWPFDPKDGPDNIFQPGEFYEGGIDLSAFPELAGTCFTSFLAETRTSPSVGSQLKDFVGGQFEDCEATVDTTPSDADGDPLPSITLGDSIHDHAVVTGTGSTEAPSGTMDFYICSPAQLTGGVCATGGTEVNGPIGGDSVPLVQIGTTASSEATSSAFTPTSVGTWCWRGEYSGDDVYDPAEDSSAGECFVVNTIPTTTVTDQSWTPNDSATITTTGPAGYNLTGSVTFSLYGPGDATCDGTPKYQETVNIPAAAGLTETVKTTNGDGVGAGLAADYIVVDGTSEGAYRWVVTYSPAAGDTAHTGSESDCVEASTVSITEP